MSLYICSGPFGLSCEHQPQCFSIVAYIAFVHSKLPLLLPLNAARFLIFHTLCRLAAGNNKKISGVVTFHDVVMGRVRSSFVRRGFTTRRSMKHPIALTHSMGMYPNTAESQRSDIREIAVVAARLRLAVAAASRMRVDVGKNTVRLRFDLMV
jgi:hypothetical protein